MNETERDVYLRIRIWIHLIAFYFIFLVFVFSATKLCQTDVGALCDSKHKSNFVYRFWTLLLALFCSLLCFSPCAPLPSQHSTNTTYFGRILQFSHQNNFVKILINVCTQLTIHYLWFTICTLNFACDFCAALNSLRTVVYLFTFVVGLAGAGLEILYIIYSDELHYYYMVCRGDVPRKTKQDANLRNGQLFSLKLKVRKRGRETNIGFFVCPQWDGHVSWKKKCAFINWSTENYHTFVGTIFKCGQQYK